MKNFIKILFLLALIAPLIIFKSAELEAQESTTTPEASTTPSYALPPEVQAAIDAQKNMKIETDNFEIDFSPQYPGPNANVSAMIISYTFDVNRATIAWIINGKISGSGKSFSFTTGSIGTRTNLTVSIITPSGRALTKSFTFQSAEADLLWETASYTPAQYRGKALPPPQSLIKVVALPRGFNVSGTRLIYEWKRNNKNIPGSSGQGKNTFSFYGAETGDEAISVKISTPDSSSAAESQTSIKISQPQIIFYENLPLEGPQYQTALGENFNLAKKEVILKAEPYFFSKRALKSISYEWQMNDKKIQTSAKPNLLNLSAPASTYGASLVRLSMSNPLNILEMAEKELKINFSNQ